MLEVNRACIQFRAPWSQGIDALTTADRDDPHLTKPHYQSVAKFHLINIHDHDWKNVVALSWQQSHQEAETQISISTFDVCMSEGVADGSEDEDKLVRLAGTPCCSADQIPCPCRPDTSNNLSVKKSLVSMTKYPAASL